MLANLACFFGGLIGMEAVAWATHRYLMHGPLWIWHRSHHEPTRRGVELNDAFAIFFAALSIAAFWLGMDPRYRLLWWLAAGMTAYGALYVLAHDGLVHRRFPFPIRPARGYLLRLVQAHHLHHLTREREGAVSFGFLWARDPEHLRARLKAARPSEP